ncbi:MAG: hypothetical protein JSW26_08720 [Desulfobacterales bacterium]|nr:MAG: hypothetical protein JSW26_08720 [Desulfobacterales bacterium]
MKDAEKNIEKEIDEKIVTPLKNQVNKIPSTIKTVAGVMVNPEAENVYQTIKTLESKWIKMRDDLDNYLFNPLKSFYHNKSGLIKYGTFWKVLV